MYGEEKEYFPQFMRKRIFFPCRMRGGALRARCVCYGRKPFVLTQRAYIYSIIVRISKFYMRVGYFYEYLACCLSTYA